MSESNIENYSLTVSQLFCESRVAPIGVDVLCPQLSWTLQAAERGQGQTAFQILVASSPALLAEAAADMWNSGRVNSPQAMHVAYAGKPLVSRQSCYWTVRVWDTAGQASPWSQTTCWEMGILQQQDWQAQWICNIQEQVPEHLPSTASPLFRQTFTVEKPVAQARLFICGLGFFEATLNGAKVGDHVLDPAFTRYDRRSLYVTFDVTEQLQPGDNALGVMLGNGWYNCRVGDSWHFDTATWRDNPRLILELHLSYTDGSTTVVTTNKSWRSARGPAVHEGLRCGETYDARCEMAGWATATFDDVAWTPVEIATGPGGVLSAQALPCKVMDTLVPVSINEVSPGVYIYDFGQNLTGWAQLTVQGAAGTSVTMRYAERLTDAGDIDQQHIAQFVKSGPFQTDTYILRGEGIEVWEPHFTFHGYQYVQVTGFPGIPTLDSLRARVIHTAFASAGEFSCSNDLLNAIQRCTRWSYISNFVGIPMDCPHREKNGWTGDANIAAELGLWNFASAPAYVKWLNDLGDEQRPNGALPGIVPTPAWGYSWGNGPAWDCAYTHIPWYLYLYTSDTQPMANHYPHLQQYMVYLDTLATDHRVSFGLGDWCPPEETRITPTWVTSTGYYYANYRLLAKMAQVLGKEADVLRYTAKADEIQQAFLATAVDTATGQVADNSQTALSCALYQGLIPDALRARVGEQLVAAVERKNRHLDTGILGAKFLFRSLTDIGRTDLAYAVATQTDFPSYGLWLAQGATTLWESWHGDTSRNHIMFGDISAWFFQAIAGLAPDQANPGFRHVVIRPALLEQLTWVRAAHRSLAGEVKIAWERTATGISCAVNVPVNTTATLILPTDDISTLTEGGQPLNAVSGITVGPATPGSTNLELVSGSYTFMMSQG